MISILKTCKKKKKTLLVWFQCNFDIEFLELLNICTFQKPYNSQQSYINV